MNGSNFRNEYKSAMEELTPNSELLDHITMHMRTDETESVRYPANSKSFFARHRSVMTAAATFAVIIGIFAVGAVVVSHFNNTGLDNVSGNAAEAFPDVNGGESDYQIELEDSIKSDGALAPPEAFISNDANDATNELGTSGAASQDGEYSDSLLRELAEKARNGTLSVYDVGKNITIQENDLNCLVFCSFDRGGVSYTLTAEFENIDGELKAVNLYITSDEQNDEIRQIDLISSSDSLEDYFAGNF